MTTTTFESNGITIQLEKKGKGVDILLLTDKPYPRMVSLDLPTDKRNQLYSLIKTYANELWPNHKEHDVTGVGNDYTEYYDKVLDNDGGLSLQNNQLTFYLPGYHLDSPRLYRFTRKNIETFLFDLKKGTTQ